MWDRSQILSVNLEIIGRPISILLMTLSYGSKRKQHTENNEPTDSSIRVFSQWPICEKKHWGVADRQEGGGAAGTNM